MWVGEPLGHAGGLTVAPHEPVHRDGGERERLLVAVAAEAHEQRLLVEQTDAAGERVNPQQRLERQLELVRILNGGRKTISTTNGVVVLHRYPLLVQLATTQLGLQEQLASVQPGLQGAAGAAGRGAVQQKLGVIAACVERQATS